MMAKPAATKIRLRNKLQDRPPRPDPPRLRHLPPPTPPEIRRRRSLRPRRRRQLPEDDFYDFDHDEEEEERGSKKLRLVVKLPTSPAVRPRRATTVPSVSSSSSSPSPSPCPASSSSSYVEDDATGENGEEEEETVRPPRKRRIDRCVDVTVLPFSRSGRQEERKKNAVGRLSANGPGNLSSTWSGTPMPERKELELILHKLQKNDIYGAFAEPVDPEELPDYHDVIEHPMDFGTVRKKLSRGAYRSFEQFEDDVLLICSNAMQYNAPDTVYFRQASVIQDLARKKFQNVKDNMVTESDQLIEEKANLSLMEKNRQLTQCISKSQQKAVVKPYLSDLYSGSTVASTSDTCPRLSTVNSIEKSVAINGLSDASFQRGSKEEKSVANELLNAISMRVSKQEKNMPVNRTLDTSSSLGKNRLEKSVTVNRFVDASSSPRESKLEKSVAFNRHLDTSSSPRESKPQKSVAVNRFLDSSFPWESKQNKHAAVNKFIDSSSALAESKQKSVAINRFLDTSSSPREIKQEKSVAFNRFLDVSSSPRESKQEKPATVNRFVDTSSSPGESKQEKPVTVSVLLECSSSIGEGKQEKSVTVNGLDSSSSLGERKQEKGDDFSAKSSPSKLSRKSAVDENRRGTYGISLEQNPTQDSNFVINIFEDGQKLLVPVGLDTEHAYARSLAQFAASLGPGAWEIVSKKIKSSLPPETKFGRGWVGEYVPLPAAFLSVQKHNQQPTNCSTSFSRTDAKNKVVDTKSKKQITLTSHKKATNSSKITSYSNSGEQKPKPLSVSSTTAHSNINGTTFTPKQCTSSNQTTNQKPFLTSVRVKEETTSEEIAERGQDVIHPNTFSNSATKINLHQHKNPVPSFVNATSSPPSKDRQSTFPGIFPEKGVRPVPSPNLNNPPDRANNSFTFISSSQDGANLGSSRGNSIDQALMDPFKLAAFSGKVGNQQKLSMPVVSSLCKESFTPTTSAPRAWMSVGTAAQWKPVDGRSVSEKSNLSPFSHASWRPQTLFNGDFMNMCSPTNTPLVRNQGLVIFPQLIPTDLSKYKNPPHWQTSGTQPQGKKRDNLPPDLNIGYQPPSSPIQASSNLAMDSQQPDLALQL